MVYYKSIIRKLRSNTHVENEEKNYYGKLKENYNTEQDY